MTYKNLSALGLLITFLTVSTNAFAHEKMQVQLDKACEEAREVALKPLRKEIYAECMQKSDNNKSDCKADAKAYNGNRINGAPRFYELPACEKAFEYRSNH